jgi:hypothetical protein
MGSELALSEWHTKFERQINALVSSVEAEVETALAAGVAEAAIRTRREVSEDLNQRIRCLRQAGQNETVLVSLIDSSAPYSRRAAVFCFDGDEARAQAQRNLGAETLVFPSEQAAAFLAAIETRDPVVAASSGSEISPTLASAAGGEPSERAYLFPLVVRQRVSAIVFASGGVQAASLELLCEAAAMRLESLQHEPAATKPKPAPADLVQLGPAGKPAATQPAATQKAWTELGPDEQRLHLRAQRLARVHVAELRMAHREAVRQGVAQANLYNLLKPEIDALRLQYGREFVDASPTMVDYLYLELVRSLANHDERLLGPDFPGPLV